MKRKVVLQIEVDGDDDEKCGVCPWMKAWHDIVRCNLFNTYIAHIGSPNPCCRCRGCIDSEVKDGTTD